MLASYTFHGGESVPEQHGADVFAPVPSAHRCGLLVSHCWCMTIWSVRKYTSKWLATPSNAGYVMTLGSRPLPSDDTFKSCHVTPPLSLSNWYVSPMPSPGLGTGLRAAMNTVLASCGAVATRHGSPGFCGAGGLPSTGCGNVPALQSVSVGQVLPP